MAVVKMMTLLLSDKIKWSRVAGIGAVAVIIIMALYVHLQQIALEHSRVVYQNPRRVEHVKIVRVTGPVRIITKTVKTPDREEITREEIREPVVEVRENVKISEPVLEAPRLNRWLVGTAVHPWSRADAEKWTAYIGHSFNNRIDLCLGMSNTGRQSVLAVFRF